MLQTNVILNGGKFGRKLKQQVLSPIFDDDRDLPPPSRVFCSGATDNCQVSGNLL